MFAVLVVALGFIVTANGQFSGGLVSQQCLQCICDRESGCKPIGCHYDHGSDSCGYFQIKKPYYIDCGSPGAGWTKCSDDKMCSSLCVQKYMQRYIPSSGCNYTCESYARTHNGGPKGCRSPSTEGYWEAIKRQPGCAHVTR